MYLRYDSEATWEEVVSAVRRDKVREKFDCPAIVLNRFKEVETKHGMTVKNTYANLLCTTGYFALDVDGTGKYTAITKESLKAIEELKLIWVSSSGDGVKAIGFHSILCNLTPSNFWQRYRWLCYDIRRRAGLKINFDRMQGRCHQPVFLNSDRKAFIRK